MVHLNLLDEQRQKELLELTRYELIENFIENKLFKNKGEFKGTIENILKELYKESSIDWKEFLISEDKTLIKFVFVVDSDDIYFICIIFDFINNSNTNIPKEFQIEKTYPKWDIFLTEDDPNTIAFKNILTKQIKYKKRFYFKCSCIDV